MNAFPQQIQNQLLMAFHRAAKEVPAYRELCREQGVRTELIVDLESFTRLCPILERSNTFDRFPIDRLCAGGEQGDLAQVLTSSGHGGSGRFSFGLTDRKQAALNEYFIDQSMDEAFQVKTRKTLVINSLPMGVFFSSQCMTVANTSVREDMAAALIQAFGKYYAQIILVGDPLFMKKLTDYALEKSLEWCQFKLNAVIGEEIFGEHYRGFIAERLGLTREQRIMASMGVAELGLHLCYETPATIDLRRAAFNNPKFAQDLFGIDPDRMVLPMLYSFHPQRIFVESIGQDTEGYGQMTVSLLDTGLTVPLMRYQTGDAIRLLEPDTVAAAAHLHGIPPPAPRRPAELPFSPNKVGLTNTYLTVRMWAFTKMPYMQTKKRLDTLPGPFELYSRATNARCISNSIVPISRICRGNKPSAAPFQARCSRKNSSCGHTDASRLA